MAYTPLHDTSIDNPVKATVLARQRESGTQPFYYPFLLSPPGQASIGEL